MAEKCTALSTVGFLHSAIFVVGFELLMVILNIYLDVLQYTNCQIFLWDICLESIKM